MVDHKGMVKHSLSMLQLHVVKLGPLPLKGKLVIWGLRDINPLGLKHQVSCTHSINKVVP